MTLSDETRAGVAERLAARAAYTPATYEAARRRCERACEALDEAKATAARLVTDAEAEWAAAYQLLADHEVSPGVPLSHCVQWG